MYDVYVCMCDDVLMYMMSSTLNSGQMSIKKKQNVIGCNDFDQMHSEVPKILFLTISSKNAGSGVFDKKQYWIYYKKPNTQNSFYGILMNYENSQIIMANHKKQNHGSELFGK